MISTLRTLTAGFSARAEETVRDHYSIELIEQKIRESEHGLKNAKLTLAGLIQQKRSEDRQVAALQGRVDDILSRAKDAMGAGREDLAQEAAQAVAQMENELTVRNNTCRTLETRVLQMRHCVETATRRLIDLKQGAKSARAVALDQAMQRKIGRTFADPTAMAEAEELVARVLQRDDPFEQQAILTEIDESLTGADVRDRLATNGFGPNSKTTAADIMARIKSETIDPDA